MQVRHLELLRELAVRGTLAAVAEATHRTPSALSQQLRSAERELGVRLIEPHSRGIRLTEAGRVLADSADGVGAALAEAQRRLDEVVGQPSGEVRIGALPSAGTALLPELFARLQGTAIRLSIEDLDLAEADYAARTADADIVIAHSLVADVPPGAEHLVSRVLAREPIDVAVPSGHPLVGRQDLRPRDLLGTRWIGVPVGYPFDAILQAAEARLDAPLERVIRLRDNRLTEALVAAGVGLALLPRFTTPAHSGYRLVPIRDVAADRRIIALSRRDRAERLAVRTVLGHLTDIGGAL